MLMLTSNLKSVKVKLKSSMKSACQRSDYKQKLNIEYASKKESPHNCQTHSSLNPTNLTTASSRVQTYPTITTLNQACNYCIQWLCAISDQDRSQEGIRVGQFNCCNFSQSPHRRVNPEDEKGKIQSRKQTHPRWRSEGIMLLIMIDQGGKNEEIRSPANRVQRTNRTEKEKVCQPLHHTHWRRGSSSPASWEIR